MENLTGKLQANRLDIVFDTYLNNIIKNATREARSRADRILFNKDGNVQSDLPESLLNCENKIVLYDLLQM